jgi:hypothetical protein
LVLRGAELTGLVQCVRACAVVSPPNTPDNSPGVVTALPCSTPQLEFFNVDEFEVLAAAEHFMATDVEWDPTGACVGVTCLSVLTCECVAWHCTHAPTQRAC